MNAKLVFPILFFAVTVQCFAEQTATDPEAKPYIGTWAGKEIPQLGLPAPKLKIRKDGSGAYFLGSPDKPLYEFTWKMGEEQLQAAANDGERFFAAIMRPDGKLMWRQVKLKPGVKTEAKEFEKVPSDF